MGPSEGLMDFSGLWMGVSGGQMEPSVAQMQVFGGGMEIYGGWMKSSGGWMEVSNGTNPRLSGPPCHDLSVTEPKAPSQILTVLSLITGAVAPLVTLVYLVVSRDPFVLGAALCSTVIFSSATIAIIGLSKAYEIKNSSLRFCVLASLTLNSVMLLFVLTTQAIGISTVLFKR